MVKLKSLQCYVCGKQSYPYFAYPYFAGNNHSDPKLCDECHNEICCGQCALTVKHCSKTGNKWIMGLPVEFLPIMAYFGKYAPVEELHLLSVKQWSPLFCRRCSSPKKAVTTKVTVAITCPLCDSEEFTNCQESVKKSDGLDEGGVNIILELHDLLHTDDGSPMKQNLFSLKERIYKPESWCGASFDVKDLFTQIDDNGRFRCQYCRPHPNFFHSIWNTQCVYYFNLFSSFNRDVGDLKQLTYAKWTPFKCEKCAAAFSETEERMPMLDKKLHKNTIVCQKCSKNGTHNEGNFIKLHILIEVIKEFRQYFKDNGSESLQADSPTTKNDEMRKEPLHKESSLMTTFTIYDAYTPRCQCGRYEEVTEMKNCSTCHVSALCAKCIVNDHWHHQITATMPDPDLEQPLNVFFKSEEGREMWAYIGKWQDRLHKTNKKGVQTMKDIESALLSNERIHGHIRPEHLDGLLMHSMTELYRIFAKIDDFWEELQELPLLKEE